jgi:hypothetical protein
MDHKERLKDISLRVKRNQRHMEVIVFLSRLIKPGLIFCLAAWIIVAIPLTTIRPTVVLALGLLTAFIFNLGMLVKKMLPLLVKQSIGLADEFQQALLEMIKKP